MKKFLYFLLPAVLLFNACSQSNTNPNNNNTGCNSTSVPNVFIEINFNGMTHRVEGYDWNGSKIRPTCMFLPLQDPVRTQLSISGGGGLCPTGGGYLGGFDGFSLTGSKDGSITTGNYLGGANVTCNHTSSIPKMYAMDSALINITNISTDFVTGTFTGKISDATSSWPATGSFNVVRFN